LKKSVTTPTTKRRLRETVRAATRQALLTAAEQVFAEKGIDGARIEDIASRAGVAVGTVYNYFSDSRALVRGLIEERGRNLLAKLDEAPAARRTTAASWSADVAAFIRVTVDFICEHHPFYVIIMQCENRMGPSSVTQLSDELYARAEALVKRGVRAGAVRSADATMLPALLLSVCRAPLVHVRHAGPRVGASWTQDVSRQIMDFFARGVAAKPVSGPRRA
jgi:AcrR family transcriptional regulator